MIYYTALWLWLQHWKSWENKLRECLFPSKFATNFEWVLNSFDKNIKSDQKFRALSLFSANQWSKLLSFNTTLRAKNELVRCDRRRLKNRNAALCSGHAGVVKTVASRRAALNRGGGEGGGLSFTWIQNNFIVFVCTRSIVIHDAKVCKKKSRLFLRIHCAPYQINCTNQMYACMRWNGRQHSPYIYFMSARACVRSTNAMVTSHLFAQNRIAVLSWHILSQRILVACLLPLQKIFWSLCKMMMLDTASVVVQMNLPHVLALPLYCFSFP